MDGKILNRQTTQIPGTTGISNRHIHVVCCLAGTWSAIKGLTVERTPFLQRLANWKNYKYCMSYYIHTHHVIYYFSSLACPFLHKPTFGLEHIFKSCPTDNWWSVASPEPYLTRLRIWIPSLICTFVSSGRVSPAILHVSNGVGIIVLRTLHRNQEHRRQLSGWNALVAGHLDEPPRVSRFWVCA